MVVDDGHAEFAQQRLPFGHGWNGVLVWRHSADGFVLENFVVEVDSVGRR